jgi:hypothetical protein
MEVLFMERVKPATITTLFFLILTCGILFAGCISGRPGSENQEQNTDVNATAVSIALNDSRLKTWLAYDGSHEILYVGPTYFESDDTIFNATAVEIDTPNALYHVYVNVTNGTVDFIWSQPKRNPLPSAPEGIMAPGSLSG